MVNMINAMPAESSLTKQAGSVRDAVASKVRVLGVLVVGFVLTACSGEFLVDYPEPLDPAVTREWNVTDVQVTVPPQLTVSDQNVFIPNADIVWHGDPPGDRRAQVQNIVTAAVKEATSQLQGSRPVTLAVTVNEFHGVSPKAMAQAPAAVHNINFTAQVIDRSTGQVIAGPAVISADLDALVGAQAVYAAEQGDTQKARVTRHIAAVLRGWLGLGPDIRGTFSSAGR